MADGDTHIRRPFLVQPGHAHTGTSPETVINVAGAIAADEVMTLSFEIAVRGPSGNFGFVGRILIAKNSSGTPQNATLAGNALDPNALSYTVAIGSSGNVTVAAESGARSTFAAHGVSIIENETF